MLNRESARFDTAEMSEPRPTRQALTTERKVQVGFAVALACLVVVGTVSFLSVSRLNRDAALVGHTYEVMNRLDALWSSVMDAQSGGRRYGTLGGDENLDRYRQGVAQVQKTLPELRGLVADNPTQQARLTAVEQLTVERLADLSALLDVRRSQGLEAAQRADATRGRQLADELEKAVEGMKGAEQVLLRERQVRTREATLATQIVIFSGGLLAMTIAALALIAIRRDFVGRYRAEQALRVANEALELRVRERTAELEQSNDSLREGEKRLQRQLTRLRLLSQVTRAIAERQDVRSIFQVVIRTLEEHMPLDFCCIFLRDSTEQQLMLTCIGGRSESFAKSLTVPESASISIDDSGLSRCVSGRLIYVPDVQDAQFPFLQRLVSGGLRSMVAAPLIVQSEVFGVLISARSAPQSFSSGDSEFLQQVSEHVALATRQAQLYQALQGAYNDLRQTQQAVMQQERLLALGKMASGIAHDINNGISPISIYTDLMLERTPDLPPGIRGYLEIIQRAIGDVAATVSRMRDFYRQREPQQKLQAVDLNGLVSQVLGHTRARWNDMAQQRGTVIEVHAELAADLPTIAGIESELRDALTNLIFNAIDAMPEGGRLDLRTHLNERDGGGSAKTGSERAIQIEVQDSGVGMDEDTRRRCLEPFFTTKGDRGTGLGLAMVYGTLRRHGADIDIQSIVGHGTTVTLTFPAPVLSASDSAESEPIRHIPPHKILLVDDDPIILHSMRDTLEGDGHYVSIADGGQAGIDAFLAARTSGTPFQVVITDLGMPYVDGRSVSRAIKAVEPDTLVVLLTGWGQQLVEDGEIPNAVDRVLSKPPKLREVREALGLYARAQGDVR